MPTGLPSAVPKPKVGILQLPQQPLHLISQSQSLPHLLTPTSTDAENLAQSDHVHYISTAFGVCSLSQFRYYTLVT